MGEPTAEVAEVAEVAIVGAGIAGLATAIALTRVGIVGVVVLESHAELRAAGAGIGLFPNAWHALRALGVAHKLDSAYSTVQGFRVSSLETGVTHKFAGSTKKRNHTAARMVHRKALLEALADELPKGTIRFSSKVTAIEQDDQDAAKTTMLQLSNGAIIRARVVVGCDGINSVVARWLGLPEPINSGRSEVRGLALFPEGHGLKSVVQQYHSDGVRAAYVPLDATSVHWFLVNNTTSSEKDMYAHPEQILEEVTTNLAASFPEDFLLMVRRTDLSSVTWAPQRFRAPWCILFGRAFRGAVTVAGDAFHPMTPDLGQGGSLALEDAVVLARALAEAATPSDGVVAYVAERRPRTAWIVAGSFVSGWVQQGGVAQKGAWAGIVRAFRDRLFHPFIRPRLAQSALYDCGELPNKV